MILFKELSKVYKNSHETVALENINLKIGEKEFLTITGASGAGKTTLLKMLTAEERPTRGTVYLDSLEITTMKQHELPFLRRRIGSIFQDFKLLPKRTAYENIAFALELMGKEAAEIKENVSRILELVGLSRVQNNFPHELSGGEKQRVSIARAIVQKPDILIADEPTGNLDPLNTWEVINLLLKINELGTTVILASHNQEVINALKRRVVTLDKGRVIRDEEKGKFIY